MSAVVDRSVEISKSSTPAPRVQAPFWQQVWTILRKDIMIEARSGEVLTSSAYLGFLIVLVSSMAFFTGPDSGPLVAPGVIWISISFSLILSLTRSWQRERDGSALDGLLTSPVSHHAIFLAKTASIWTFLIILSLVVVPIAALFLAIDLLEIGTSLSLLVLAASPGIAAMGTIFGLMTVRTGARDLLVTVAIFPLLLPTLLTAVVATRELLIGAAAADMAQYFSLIAVFDIVFFVGAAGLFGILVER